MDRVSFRELITSALPTARALTGDFWDTYVEHDQEMLYPLELFAAIAFQCHGLSRYRTNGYVYVCTRVRYEKTIGSVADTMYFKLSIQHVIYQKSSVFILKR